MEPAWPVALQEELHGEPVLFATRERRLVSRSGTFGAVALGVLLLVAAAVQYLLRSVPGVHITAPFVDAMSDSPEGQQVLLLGSRAAVILALIIFVLSYVFRTREGAHVVGTHTRMLRTGPFGVTTVRWRDIESVRSGSDGTVRLVPFKAGPQPRSWSLEIVETPHAAEITAKIRVLLAPSGERPPDLDGPRSTATREFAFRAAYTPGMQAQWQAKVIAVVASTIGLLLMTFVATSLLSGETATVSTNGGPEREVGAGDPIAWFPFGLGVVIAAVGVGIFLLMRPRRKPVDFVAREDALVMTRQGQAAVEYPWRLFTGEFTTRRTRRGHRISLPLRRLTASRSGSGTQEILQIIGVENVDEVSAELNRRMRA